VLGSRKAAAERTRQISRNDERLSTLIQGMHFADGRLTVSPGLAKGRSKSVSRIHNMGACQRSQCVLNGLSPESIAFECAAWKIQQAAQDFRRLLCRAHQIAPNYLICLGPSTLQPGTSASIRSSCQSVGRGYVSADQIALAASAFDRPDRPGWAGSRLSGPSPSCNSECQGTEAHQHFAPRRSNDRTSACGCHRILQLRTFPIYVSALNNFARLSMSAALASPITK